MSITSAQYYDNDITEERSGIRVKYSDGKETCVPINPQLGLYNEIMKMVEDGDLTIADAE
tara:strand:- start:355 stop:534 length:180 start_codon:yes stop_codon:yes gene_type:complete